MITVKNAKIMVMIAVKWLVHVCLPVSAWKKCYISEKYSKMGVLRFPKSEPSVKIRFGFREFWTTFWSKVKDKTIITGRHNFKLARYKFAYECCLLFECFAFSYLLASSTVKTLLPDRSTMIFQHIEPPICQFSSQRSTFENWIKILAQHLPLLPTEMRDVHTHPNWVANSAWLEHTVHFFLENLVVSRGKSTKFWQIGASGINLNLWALLYFNWLTSINDCAIRFG